MLPLGKFIAGGENMPTWLLILIIVLVVLALFGGVGYRRR
jgi:LPXTG-motif cell wall-anchored protein